jgi:formylmethanofuran dehydrogenase subunit E
VTEDDDTLTSAEFPEETAEVSLRAEVRELSRTVRVLVELLAEKGLLDEVEVRARLANARRLGIGAEAHPYRALSVPREPAPPGTIACARCGTYVAERKAFTNANGRFCRDCFEPA